MDGLPWSTRTHHTMGDFVPRRRRHVLRVGLRASSTAGEDMYPFTVYFKFKRPGEKKSGAVTLFRLYANNIEEARQLVTGYATYPDIEVIRIVQA